jgi:GTP-binding protein
MFVDEVDIQVTAGDGGRGCMSFRREKFIPRGGPDGGDGGHGGSVVLVAHPQRNTLVNFRYTPIFKAERGRSGEGSNRTGKSGRDLYIDVPLGTVVYEMSDHGPVLLGDITRETQRLRIAQGGKGGWGNARFASSTNRTPRRAEPGLPGEVKAVRLTLKLLADVGLVGFPNAGKSTLISRISAAKPKIAAYPFTTLVPNLGVVSMSGDRSFVVADIPGLIEGAHRGAGLGHQFLRHLERTRVLIHLVDVSSQSGRDPVSDFDIIRDELAQFPVDEAMGSLPLAERPQIVAANKMDALDEPERLARLRTHVERMGLPFHEISAATGDGLPSLLEAVWPHVAERLDAERIELEAAAAAPRPAAPAAPQPVRRRGRGTRLDDDTAGPARVTREIDLDGKRDGDA